MGYSIDPISDNCYPGTSVLINKFDIRDEAKLNEVESVLVSARNAEWLNEPEVSTFDFAHYKVIHHFLFSDLYDWAGQIRTVNISKKGTRFTLAENIERQAELIFKRLKDCNYFKGLPHDEFVDELVDFYRNGVGVIRRSNAKSLRPSCFIDSAQIKTEHTRKPGVVAAQWFPVILGFCQNSSQTVVKAIRGLSDSVQPVDLVNELFHIINIGMKSIFRIDRYRKHKTVGIFYANGF